MHLRLSAGGVAIAVLLGGLTPGAPARADPTSEIFDFTGAWQSYTVPVTGVYDITGYGAQGGLSDDGYTSYEYAGGQGAEASGDFSLAAGDTLAIAVGGAGDSGFYGGGGGGGSFVLAPNSVPLVVAGGGGGGGAAGIGDPGNDGPDGTTAYDGGPGVGGAGGTDGSGGANWDGGGGGGDSGNGETGFGVGGQGLPTLTGGGSVTGASGGFGGGGGAGYVSGGGGGGYSGGGGAYYYGGGGGGSFLDASAIDITLITGENIGNGEVEISLQEADPVPEPASLVLLGGGLGLLAVTLRRRHV